MPISPSGFFLLFTVYTSITFGTTKKFPLFKKNINLLIQKQLHQHYWQPFIKILTFYIPFPAFIKRILENN
ncbi:hypothetical protein C7121_05610 [Paenibacillus glucanolyticus]|nr:hypothetical protein A3958_09920 [Paenibacillus glucanolyticus]AVV55656.1 hypothetical protein C7121_05610 [Paenibacillus glucanolyticus]AWP30238.1 hypothetical protein B9D94_28115 [Paenibacillus sp. Cedars]ETT33669.1 hypothetical protein C169_22103 [Paenibacillus sp. FSL R5-808]